MLHLAFYYTPSVTVNPTAEIVSPKKLAGAFSIPENVKVYPLISPIEAPDTIVPPDTSNPCSKPATNTFPLLSSTKTVGFRKLII